MNKPEAKRIWIGLIKKHYKKEKSILEKLSRIQFIKRGEMKPETKAYKYAVKHFPALLKKFKEARDSQ